jgi:hypothetical protein
MSLQESEEERGVGDPRNAYPGWVLPFGVVCLIAGLTAASLVTWRGRWRWDGADCTVQHTNRSE